MHANIKNEPEFPKKTKISFPDAKPAPIMVPTNKKPIFNPVNISFPLKVNFPYWEPLIKLTEQKRKLFALT